MPDELKGYALEQKKLRESRERTLARYAEKGIANPSGASAAGGEGAATTPQPVKTVPPTAEEAMKAALDESEKQGRSGPASVVGSVPVAPAPDSKAPEKAKAAAPQQGIVPSDGSAEAAATGTPTAGAKVSEPKKPEGGK